LQLSLVAGLVAVGLCAVVGILVVHQSSGALSAETLLQTVARIHRKGERLMMLDDAEDPGASGARPALCVWICTASAPDGRSLTLLAAGPETLNKYLRVSADSVAYSCGGKEVAQVCLLGTETCVASMQKKSQYTTEQSIARDMGTCSCFQENGCSAGCNAAMKSMFGGYISVTDCPGDTSPFVYAGTNPYDAYGGSAFDSVYNDPGFMYSTAGAIYKANPRKQMLTEVPADEPVMLMSRPRLANTWKCRGY
jgi:hypothetical protein